MITGNARKKAAKYFAPKCPLRVINCRANSQEARLLSLRADPKVAEWHGRDGPEADSCTAT